MYEYGILKDSDSYKITYEAKVYDNPSSYGIYNGRISKLGIYINGVCVIHYDRGWDIPPKNEADDMLVRKVLNLYK